MSSEYSEEHSLSSKSRPEAREALFSVSVFRVKWFFLKKNLRLRTRPEGRRRRLSKESHSPCQPGFSAILQEMKSGDFRPQKTVWEAREACLCFVTDDSFGARNLTEHP